MTDDGQLAVARQAYERVQAFDPSYRDVSTRLQHLAKGQRPPTGSVPTAPSTADLPRLVPGRPTSSDPFAASSDAVDPRPGPPAPRRHTYVKRMAGYDVLKRLPIFEELSLDEMKAFYSICEQTKFDRGEIVIEQGYPGSGLFIVRQGQLRVTRVHEGGAEVELATIPAGQYVGEMSLVDDAPTSARVSAAEPVKALRVTKARFEQFMFSHERTALRVYRSFVKTLSTRLREQNLRR